MSFAERMGRVATEKAGCTRLACDGFGIAFLPGGGGFHATDRLARSGNAAHTTQPGLRSPLVDFHVRNVQPWSADFFTAGNFPGWAAVNNFCLRWGLLLREWLGQRMAAGGREAILVNNYVNMNLFSKCQSVIYFFQFIERTEKVAPDKTGAERLADNPR